MCSRRRRGPTCSGWRRWVWRVIKTLWFDPTRGTTDAAPLDARGVAFVAAAFSFPVVMPALALIDPLSKAAASAFGLN